jgi:hypothetical protein
MVHIKLMKIIPLLLLCMSAAQAQTYKQSTEADLSTLNGISIGQSCESLKIFVENRGSRLDPFLGQSCAKNGYYDFSLYHVADEGVLSVGITPDKKIWNVTLTVNWDKKTDKPRVDSVMQSFYDRFGRPVYEKDYSNEPNLLKSYLVNSFGKAIQDSVWSSKQVNPKHTINLNKPNLCDPTIPNEAAMKCFTAQVQANNSIWNNALAGLPSVIVTAQTTNKDGYVSFMAIRMYQKEHLKPAGLAREENGKKLQEIFLQQKQQRDKEVIPKF